MFSSERVAVFVDGCFWHYCPEHRSLPVANGRWWEAKFEATVERDRRHEQELTEAGWLVIRIWGHEDLRSRLRLSPRQSESVDMPGDIPVPPADGSTTGVLGPHEGLTGLVTRLCK